MTTRHIILLLSILLIYFIQSIHTLECYVCKDQEHNQGKCVRTVKTCENGQDRCLTEVKWGGTKYWAPTGEKQYYISKRCGSKDNCTAERDKYSSRCERIWFNDWECVDCCHGDRCNYYVTLGSSMARPTFISVAIFCIITLLLY